MEENRPLLVITAIANKQNMEELQQYLGRVMQIFGQHGGKPVGRYKTIEQLTGEDTPEMIAMIEFTDTESIKDMISSEGFQGLSEMRARVFDKLNLMICGGM